MHIAEDALQSDNPIREDSKWCASGYRCGRDQKLRDDFIADRDHLHEEDQRATV